MPPLDEFLRSLDADAEQASEALERLVAQLKTIGPDTLTAHGKTDSPFRAAKRFYRRLQALEKQLVTAKRIVMETETNAYWMDKAGRQPDLKSYEKKKAFAKELAADMRNYGFAVRHPETGEPCKLLAVASADGMGRYLLANQVTKKRSHTCQSLIELFPIRLIAAPRRREGFLEKEKRGDANE